MIKGMKNVVVFVKDLDVAKKFYKEQLKLPLLQESMMMMEFFPGGTTTLGIAMAVHEDAQKLVGRHTGITLTVEGIEELCKELTEAGVHFPEPLEASPWGKMAVVADPDANLFALVEMK